MAVDLHALINAPMRGRTIDTVPPKERAPKSGYAALPGTGPTGETCKTCGNHRARQFAKVYHKCTLTETGGATTDIRVSSPACAKWVAP